MTSTPTLEDLYTGPCLRKNADIRQYNALAQAVMERDGVPVLDLYTVASCFPESWWDDHVHFTAEGAQALAETICTAAEAVLDRK